MTYALNEKGFQEDHEYGGFLPSNKRNIFLLRRHMELTIPESHREHVTFVDHQDSDDIGWIYKNA